MVFAPAVRVVRLMVGKWSDSNRIMPQQTSTLPLLIKPFKTNSRRLDDWIKEDRPSCVQMAAWWLLVDDHRSDLCRVSLTIAALLLAVHTTPLLVANLVRQGGSTSPPLLLLKGHSPVCWRRGLFGLSVNIDHLRLPCSLAPPPSPPKPPRCSFRYY